MSGQRHWLDEPRSVKRLWRGFLAVLAATVLAGFAVPAESHFAFESLPAFNAVFGFLSCAAMILGARLLGVFLKRPDTYYRSGDE